MGAYTKEIDINEFLNLVLENGSDFTVKKREHYFGNDYTITFNNLKKVVTVTLGHFINAFRIENHG